MRAVTKFVSEDGVEFADPGSCKHYEEHAREVARVMQALPPVRVEDAQWVQLRPEVVLAVQRALVVIFEAYHPGMADEHTMWARDASRPAGLSMIGRYVDDCGSNAERDAWARLQRIDTLFREHSQPYYAVQADKKRGL